MQGTFHCPILTTTTNNNPCEIGQDEWLAIRDPHDRVLDQKERESESCSPDSPTLSSHPSSVSYRNSRATGRSEGKVIFRTLRQCLFPSYNSFILTGWKQLGWEKGGHHIPPMSKLTLSASQLCSGSDIGGPFPLCSSTYFRVGGLFIRQPNCLPNHVLAILILFSLLAPSLRW